MSGLDETFQVLMATVATGIAHEVRNPLNALQINLSILGEELARLAPDPEEHVHQVLSKIARQVRDLDNFVEDFLRYARPPTPRKVSVELESLLRDLIDFLLPQCNELGVAVRLDVVPGLRVQADGFQLKQALLNLLLNALDASTGAASIAVTATARARRVAITVTDDGAGIPADVQPHIFEAFFTTRERGTGLGLPLARRIAEMHGGTLTVASQTGKGTAVTLELPLEGES